MATFDELATRYARKLRQAARKDKDRQKIGLLENVEEWGYSDLADALREVGRKIERLRWTGRDDHFSEEDKLRLVRLIAEKIEYKKPKRLRRLLREGSIDALMAMCQQIEALFASMRK